MSSKRVIRTAVGLLVLAASTSAVAQGTHVVVDRARGATLPSLLVKDATAKPKHGICLPEPLDEDRLQLGLRPGDCLRELSGLPVESATAVRDAYKRLQGAARIYLAIDRLGARVTIEVELADAAAVVAAQSRPEARLDRDVRCPTATRCQIKRQLFEELFADPASPLLTSARIVPSVENGVPNGFKLFAIRPDSLFARLGFQNGDTLQQINGVALTSPAKALEIYAEIKTAKLIKVVVLRRGAPTNLEIAIVD